MDILRRKADHLDLAARGDVAFRDTTTLLECVTLEHNSLPELDFHAIDTSCRILGKRLRAPILIAAMTGGTQRSARINRELASIAEERGYAFGLGSQRPMLLDPDAADTYRVRDVAPSALVLGNIGAVQAARLSAREVQCLVDDVGADALCVHFSPAMELVQAEGDRDFRGCIAKLAELRETLTVPIVAKETGSGISSHVARTLASRGIRHVDVSGAGGTSWVGVEYHRANDARKPIAETFWDWGIPTAASVGMCASCGMETIFATGGISSGLDIAKAIALGASAGGVARRVLQALESGGREAASTLLDRIETELRMTMLLVGAGTVAALRRTRSHVSGPLRDWLEGGDTKPTMGRADGERG